LTLELLADGVVMGVLVCGAFDGCAFNDPGSGTTDAVG
jgi:hypothetical protein